MFMFRAHRSTPLDGHKRRVDGRITSGIDNNWIYLDNQKLSISNGKVQSYRYLSSPPALTPEHDGSDTFRHVKYFDGDGKLLFHLPKHLIVDAQDDDTLRSSEIYTDHDFLNTSLFSVPPLFNATNTSQGSEQGQQNSISNVEHVDHIEIIFPHDPTSNVTDQDKLDAFALLAEEDDKSLASACKLFQVIPSSCDMDSLSSDVQGEDSDSASTHTVRDMLVNVDFPSDDVTEMSSNSCMWGLDSLYSGNILVVEKSTVVSSKPTVSTRLPKTSPLTLTGRLLGRLFSCASGLRLAVVEESVKQHRRAKSDTQHMIMDVDEYCDEYLEESVSSANFEGCGAKYRPWQPSVSMELIEI